MSTNLINYEEKWASMAKQYADEEKAGGAFLLTRGGVLTLGEDKMPGNRICAIILDAVRENTYYGEEKFDAKNIVPPLCYAYGYSEDDMVPDFGNMEKHPKWFQAQADGCAGCAWNEWGSGRGAAKACSNRRRLALIPAGVYEPRGKKSSDFDLGLFDSTEDFKSSDIVFLKIPPTSVRNWSKFVHMLENDLRRPPAGVITEIYLENHEDNQFEVKFDLIEELPKEFAEIVMQRHVEATKIIASPYQVPNEADKPDNRGTSGLRNKARR